MSDSLDAKTVMQVANLARIELPEAAVNACQQELSRVLDYISQLNELKLPEKVEPFFGAVESFNATRHDVVGASSPRKEILENAPDTDGEFYRVPPVFNQ